MSGSEAETPVKTSKASSGSAEQPTASSTTATPVAYPEWPGFQAYPSMPPHGFFPSPAASSPQAHHFIWGAQHVMHPYGTPPPYVMYPPGGLYAHPSLPTVSHPFTPYTTTSSNGKVDGPSISDAEGKERSPSKRPKGGLGNLNMVTGKNDNEPGKATVAATNGVFSQSWESGSEASSDGSDGNSENGSQPNTSQNGNNKSDSQNGINKLASQTGQNQCLSILNSPTTNATGGVSGPTTNLNIGMNYATIPTNPQATTTPRGKASVSPVGGTVVPSGYFGSRENVSSDLWMQDERELKRQRRKQSNRESARRSRLRKQAECEELAQKVEVLKEENASLRAEVTRIRKDFDELLAQNASLKERLHEFPGEDPKSEVCLHSDAKDVVQSN